jgi:NAD(P) transhydrogenase subunit alpha
MKIGIVKEIADSRVAATPETVGKMVKAGLAVAVETGAGLAAGMADEEYLKTGATVASDAATLLADTDLVLKVQRPQIDPTDGRHEVEKIREGAALICLLSPLTDHDVVRRLAARKVAAFAADLMPRITRAQRMDVLSAMSSVSGYKAVLLAASAFGKFVPMMTTAVGTLPPARALILGAGVAGLQAIATAKRLGAQVEAFDTRPATKEQVQSLGAEFVELNLGTASTEDAGGYAKALSDDHAKQVQALIGERVKNADLVITTALVPGRRAPVLITATMVASMKPGSVIVDLAAEQGGNCDLTTLGQSVAHGVTIIGAANLAATLPIHASQMYAKAILAFVTHLTPNQSLKIDLSDEITQGTLVTQNGAILHPAVKAALTPASSVSPH